jgi:hypothetical protein
MTKIKNFKEFQKTNESFGDFSDFSTQILEKLNKMTKKLLIDWLKTQSDDFQKNWCKENANDFIQQELKKQSPPDNKWPEIFDNGKLTIEKVVDWIYSKNRENKIDFEPVYLPKNPPSVDLINLQSNNHYFFITDFNSVRYRIEVWKESFGNYKLKAIKEKEKSTMQTTSRPRMSGTMKIPTTTSGYVNAPTMPSDFVSGISQVIENSSTPEIFKKAAIVHNIIKEMPGKNISK